jgi:hypothetical protein
MGSRRHLLALNAQTLTVLHRIFGAEGLVVLCESCREPITAVDVDFQTN